jgi:hypothetical protein
VRWWVVGGNTYVVSEAFDSADDGDGGVVDGDGDVFLAGGGEGGEVHPFGGVVLVWRWDGGDGCG